MGASLGVHREAWAYVQTEEITTDVSDFERARLELNLTLNNMRGLISALFAEKYVAFAYYKGRKVSHGVGKISSLVKEVSRGFGVVNGRETRTNVTALKYNIDEPTHDDNGNFTVVKHEFIILDSQLKEHIRVKGKMVQRVRKLKQEEMQSHLWLKYSDIFTKVKMPPPIEKKVGPLIRQYKQHNAQEVDNNDFKNKDYPGINWALTLTQLEKYINHCKKSVLWWQAYFNSSGALNTVDKFYVNLYNLKGSFIVHQTKGTGRGIALSMQPQSQQWQVQTVPLTPPLFKGRLKYIMISHMWAEDIDEVVTMLKAQIGVLKLNDGTRFSANTRLWFCVTANFQVNRGDENNDPLGPTVNEICAKNPFKSIIYHPHVHDMIIIHTSTGDPYSRFWCVYELYVARKRQLGLKIKAGLGPYDKNPAEENGDGKFSIHPLFSHEFLECMITWDEATQSASFKNNHDLRQVLLKKGHLKKNVPDGEPHKWVMSHPVILKQDTYYTGGDGGGQLSVESEKLWKEFKEADRRLQPDALADYINKYIRGVQAVGWKRRMKQKDDPISYPPNKEFDPPPYTYTPPMRLQNSGPPKHLANDTPTKTL